MSIALPACPLSIQINLGEERIQRDKPDNRPPSRYNQASMQYVVPVALLIFGVVMAQLGAAQITAAQDGAETGLDLPEADAGVELDIPEAHADVDAVPKSSEIKPKMKVGKDVHLGVGTMDPDSALPDGSAVEPPDDKFDLEDPAGGVTLKKSF